MTATNLSIFMEYDLSSDSSVESRDDYTPLSICFVDTTIDSSTISANGNKFRIEEEMDWKFKRTDGIKARHGIYQGLELPCTNYVFFAGTFRQNLKPLYRMGYKLKYGSVYEDVDLWPIDARARAQIEFCNRNCDLMGCDVM
jgi:hypothetical protein